MVSWSGGGGQGTGVWGGCALSLLPLSPATAIMHTCKVARGCGVARKRSQGEDQVPDMAQREVAAEFR